MLPALRRRGEQQLPDYSTEDTASESPQARYDTTDDMSSKHASML